VSSVPARTLKNGNPPCPRCKGDRCLIFWGGENCSLCVGGFYEWRGKQCKCKFCDGGKKRPRVLCNRDGQQWFDLGDVADDYTPVIKPSSPRATDAFVDLIYTAFLERCHLTADWRLHLQEERALSNDAIKAAGFVTLPMRETCNRFAAEIAETIKPPVGVPGFYEHEGQWHFRRTLHWQDSGLVVPYRNMSGQIVMLQVRSDGGDSKKRYMCMSGAPSYVSHAGTGSGAPAHWLPSIETQTLAITEGGLKAICCAELWPRLGQFSARWVGLCGLTLPRDFFAELRANMPNVTRVMMAFDREEAGTVAWKSVEKVKDKIRTEAAKWGLLLAEEPGGWRQDGARKFDDYLRGMIRCTTNPNT
jgi:hypothetical protein